MLAHGFGDIAVNVLLEGEVANFLQSKYMDNILHDAKKEGGEQIESSLEQAS